MFFPRLDNISYWVFQKCSYGLADVVAHISNILFVTGSVPTAWLSVIVTSVPKILNSKWLSFYLRHARLGEKCVDSNWVRSALTPNITNDQFPFRTSGSTTCVLTYFMHHACTFQEATDRDQTQRNTLGNAIHTSEIRACNKFLNSLTIKTTAIRFKFI